MSAISYIQAPVTAEQVAVASKQIAATAPVWKVAIIGAVAVVILGVILIPILRIMVLVDAIHDFITRENGLIARLSDRLTGD
jgi:hypothetical protein